MKLKTLLVCLIVSFMCLGLADCDLSKSTTNNVTESGAGGVEIADNDIVGDNNDSNNDDECTENTSASDQALCGGTALENVDQSVDNSAGSEGQ